MDQWTVETKKRSQHSCAMVSECAGQVVQQRKLDSGDAVENFTYHLRGNNIRRRMICQKSVGVHQNTLRWLLRTLSKHNKGLWVVCGLSVGCLWVDCVFCL